MDGVRSLFVGLDSALSVPDDDANDQPRLSPASLHPDRRHRLSSPGGGRLRSAADAVTSAPGGGAGVECGDRPAAGALLGVDELRRRCDHRRHHVDHPGAAAEPPFRHRVLLPLLLRSVDGGDRREPPSDRHRGGGGVCGLRVPPDGERRHLVAVELAVADPHPVSLHRRRLLRAFGRSNAQRATARRRGRQGPAPGRGGVDGQDRGAARGSGSVDDAGPGGAGAHLVSRHAGDSRSGLPAHDRRDPERLEPDAALAAG